MTPAPLQIETERDRERWKQVVYFLIRWIYRTWIACVTLVGVFTTLWLLEIAGMIGRDTLGTVWLGIIALGLTLLLVLIPIWVMTDDWDAS